MAKTQAATKDTVLIFDTTLRDGEQSPGATMHMEEKLLIAEALDAMGVDIIEAGFAIASLGDAGAIQQISRVVKNATICSLARALRKDIDAAAESLKHARKKRIHTFISTSPLHMEYKLKMSPEAVLEAIKDSVSYARNFTDDVEWSCEDGSRSERPFLYRAIETAIKAGARTINVPDTVGYAVPDEYAALIRDIRTNVPNSDQAVFSVHCHNDLGLAVANSLAAVAAGARQVECTVNGLGERAGNAAMEEVVMAIATRQDALPYSTNINTKHISRLSRLVSQVTGFAVQKNKAIVGANAFAHESGIHQHGMLANRQTYEIMMPESIGLTTSSLVLGKHSGRHAFVAKLKEMGIDLPEKELEAIFTQFKSLADRKKDIYDEDILALVHPSHWRKERLVFKDLYVECGSKGQKARLTLAIDGEDYTATTSGNGPVDATFKAIKSILPHEASLQLYHVQAVTRGTDAQAEVTVTLSDGEHNYNGHAADPDTLVSSAQAYIQALSRLIDAHEKQEKTYQPASYSELQKSGLGG